jgi:hypothetical protein
MFQTLLFIVATLALYAMWRETGGKILPYAMAVLSEDRDTPEREGKTFSYLVAGGKIIYAGSIVVLNSAGYAEPATTALNKVTLGRAEEQVDNSAGQNGDMSVNVRKGVFRYENSANTDAITITEIGQDCYLVDDQTVAKTSGTGTRSIAGKVRDVDDYGVWVELGN